MPYAAPRPCSRHPRILLSRGDKCPHCTDVKKNDHKEYNRKRRADPSRTDKFYSSKIWRRLRAAKLRKDPCCEECKKNGIIKAATVVDHDIPIREGGAKLDMNNLRSLCVSCHNSKTAKEWNK